MHAPRTPEEEDIALQVALAESKAQAGSAPASVFPPPPRYPSRPPPSAPTYPPVPPPSHPLFPPAVTGGTLYPPPHASPYPASPYNNHHPNYALPSYPNIPSAASAGTSAAHQHSAAQHANNQAAAQAAATRARAREIEEADARLARQLADEDARTADRERQEQRRRASEAAARALAVQREEEDARLARELAEQDARAAAAEEQSHQAAAAAAAAAAAQERARQREEEDARLARQLAEEDARAAAEAQRQQQERARAQQMEEQDARLARQLAEQEHSRLPGHQGPPQGPPAQWPPSAPYPQNTLQRIMDPFNNLVGGFLGALNNYPPPQAQPSQPLGPTPAAGGGASPPWPRQQPQQPQRPQFPLPRQLFSDPNRCAGCGMPFGLSSVTAMERKWHPQCFTCAHCGGSLAEGANIQFVPRDGLPYHSGCHRQCFHPRCYVCKELIPETGRGKIEWQVQPFWQHKYCPRHTTDGTPKCCACNQMQPKDEEFATLSDGRSICLGCVSSIVVDTKDCQPLYDEILAFFRSMGMPHPERAPMILVDRNTLNEYSGREGKDTGSGPATHVQGLCLATVYSSVPSIVRNPGSLLGVSSISTPVTRRRCNVTAVLILYGLPRLLTGCILAHELMHAWLRMKNITGLNLKVEEGLCQLLAYVWLDRQHGKLSRDLLQQRQASYFSYQIRTDVSDVYGNGFREAYEAFEMRGLTAVINDVLSRGRFA